MNELKIFENEELGKVRVVEVEGNPYFVLKDVCEVLEIAQTVRVAERLDEDEVRQTHVTDALGREQETYIVNESGLYNVIIRSDKPQAKQFKKWITSEVLPSIRKHGAYMTDETLEKALLNPDFLIKLATELKDEKALRCKMQDKIEVDRPKVLFADAVNASHTSILVGELAKLIQQNGVAIGQNRLFQWMRDNDYLLGSNMPSQYSMERGWFEVVERTINNPDGSIRITKTPKVTGKGQVYFINKHMGDYEPRRSLM